MSRDELLLILAAERDKAANNKKNDNNWFNTGYFAGRQRAFEYIIELLTEKKFAHE